MKLKQQLNNSAILNAIIARSMTHDSHLRRYKHVCEPNKLLQHFKQSLIAVSRLLGLCAA